MSTPLPRVTPALAQAFAETRFEVFDARPITLRIGLDPTGSAAWLDAIGARSAVVITAWNPFGVAQPDAVNAAADAALRDHVESAGLRALPARGTSASGDWHEESLCVLDLEADQLDTWLQRHRQAALVWVAHGEAPVLVWHPECRPASRPT